MSLHHALGRLLLSRAPLIKSVYSASAEHLPYYSHRLKKRKKKKKQQHHFQKGSDIWGSSSCASPTSPTRPPCKAGGLGGRAARLFDLFWATGAHGAQGLGLAGSRALPLFGSAAQGRPSASTCLGAGPLIIAVAAARARLALGARLDAGRGGRGGAGVGGGGAGERGRRGCRGPKCAEWARAVQEKFSKQSAWERGASGALETARASSSPFPPRGTLGSAGSCLLPFNKRHSEQQCEVKTEKATV